jgi:hypothetical protein
MKLKHWLMFSGLQLAGVLVGLGAHHVDRLSWTISILMLLPGFIVSGYFFRIGGPGNYWPIWSMFAIAATVNFVLLGVALSIRKFKRASVS